jgi:hypothetical protein
MLRIRTEQLTALDALVQVRFEERLAEFLTAEFEPAGQCPRDFVASGVHVARACGFETERQIAAYVTALYVMVTENIAEDREWASILDSRSDSTDTRASLLLAWVEERRSLLGGRWSP